jgi:hypothetical protein
LIPKGFDGCTRGYQWRRGFRLVAAHLRFSLRSRLRKRLGQLSRGRELVMDGFSNSIISRLEVLQDWRGYLDIDISLAEIIGCGSSCNCGGLLLW